MGKAKNPVDSPNCVLTVFFFGSMTRKDKRMTHRLRELGKNKNNFQRCPSPFTVLLQAGQCSEACHLSPFPTPRSWRRGFPTTTDYGYTVKVSLAAHTKQCAHGFPALLTAKKRQQRAPLIAWFVGRKKALATLCHTYDKQTPCGLQFAKTPALSKYSPCSHTCC